jgi:hypothetical protein
MDKSNELKPSAIYDRYSCARSNGAECLRSLIKFMVQIYLNDLKNKPEDLTNGQIE